MVTLLPYFPEYSTFTVKTALNMFFIYIHFIIAQILLGQHQSLSRRCAQSYIWLTIFIFTIQKSEQHQSAFCSLFM